MKVLLPSFHCRYCYRVSTVGTDTEIPNSDTGTEFPLHVPTQSFPNQILTLSWRFGKIRRAEPMACSGGGWGAHVSRRIATHLDPHLDPQKGTDDGHEMLALGVRAVGATAPKRPPQRQRPGGGGGGKCGQLHSGPQSYTSNHNCHSIDAIRHMCKYRGDQPLRVPLGRGRCAQGQ